MAITLRGTPTAGNNGAGTASLLLTHPSGTQAGDVLVASVTVRGGTGTTITPPTYNGTWTPLSRSNSTTVLGQATYWKIASAGDITYGNVTFAITTNKASGTLTALYNADSTAPVAAYYRSQANASSLTITIPASGTIAAVNGIDICMTGMAYGGNTVGTNASYTNQANSSSTGSGASSRTQSHVSTRALTPSGTSIASFTEVWTGSAAVNIGAAVYVREVSGGSGTVTGDAKVKRTPVFGTTVDTEATVDPWVPGVISGGYVNVAALALATGDAPTGGGSNSLKVTLSGASDQMALVRLDGLFKSGVVYTLKYWAKLQSGSGSIQAIFGDRTTNDRSASGAVTITGSWVQKTMTWTPSGDRGEVVVAIAGYGAVTLEARIDLVNVTPFWSVGITGDATITGATATGSMPYIGGGYYP